MNNKPIKFIMQSKVYYTKNQLLSEAGIIWSNILENKGRFLSCIN